MLTWDDTGSRIFETGVDRGVFYPNVGPGVAWNGLTSIKEDIDNSSQSVVYSDGRKLINQIKLGTFKATLEAFTYPDEFSPYDGYLDTHLSGQKRSTFNLSYRTMIYDIFGSTIGYKLHLVWNCLADPTQRNYNSFSPDADLSVFSWNLETVPLAFPYARPTAHIYLDSRTVSSEVLSTIEDILYGVIVDPRIPTVSEIIAIFDSHATIVVDNGDGTVTVTGPDDQVFHDVSDVHLWTLISPSVVLITIDTYRVSSY